MNSDFTDNETAPTPFDETMPTAAPGFIRFINYMLDCILLAVIASIIINSVAPEMMPKSFEDVSSGMFISLLYPLQFVYYFGAEFFFGRTLAKVLTKTYVTTEFNEKPGFTAIFIRTLCRYIPFEYLSFLGNGIGWHDRLSKTYVVRNPK
ncbi:RDD family protein [Adhaeribacter terreus]|uniref:RDD family protein n=1 Tax=Adhaeribacter terreus TaxID=529703 RepID=A0ABW0E4C7_9BACT